MKYLHKKIRSEETHFSEILRKLHSKNIIEY